MVFGEKANSCVSVPFSLPATTLAFLDLLLLSRENVPGLCQLHGWGKSKRPRPSARLASAEPVGVEVTALVSDVFLACWPLRSCLDVPTPGLILIPNMLTCCRSHLPLETLSSCVC